MHFNIYQLKVSFFLEKAHLRMSAEYFKAIVGFKNYSDWDLLAKAKTVLTGMTAHVATFATPSPALTVLSGNIDDYEAALNAFGAAGGGKVLRAAKDEARKQTQATLFQLGLYVQKTSNGVESLILGAGYDVHKPKTSSSPLSSPENIRVRALHKGQLKVYVNPVKGANGYEWEYKMVTETSWTNVTTTAAKIDLEDLESGKEYNVKVAAIGPSPARNFSPVVSSFVL